MTVRQRLHLTTQHGLIRALTALGARRGDPQSRLIADPAVRADPGAFADELREHGALVRGRAAWVTADHAVAHQVLRSDDFAVTAIGRSLPGPLSRLEQRLRPNGHLHPLLPPSLLSVEPPDHTRYRKTVSSVFTVRAVAALRERVQQAATSLLDELDAPSSSVIPASGRPERGRGETPGCCGDGQRCPSASGRQHGVTEFIGKGERSM